MHEDCLIIRIPKFTGYKTLAFNLLAGTFGLAALTTGVIDPVACYVLMGMGAVNVLLRLATSTPVWDQRKPGAGGGGIEQQDGFAAYSEAYRPRLPALRPVGGGSHHRLGDVAGQRPPPRTGWEMKYARQTVAPTVPRPVCVGEALAACVAAEPASLPIWGEEKFPEFLYRTIQNGQNAPLPSETLRGTLHGFLAFVLVGALALFPLAACGALSELGTAIAGQSLAGARE